MRPIDGRTTSANFVSRLLGSSAAIFGGKCHPICRALSVLMTLPYALALAMPMSSSRCAKRHMGGRIESLYTVVGILSTATPTANNRATRSFSQLRLHRTASQCHLRPWLSSQPTSPRFEIHRLAAFRPFSTTQPTFVTKGSSKLITMEQLRSRARLGVLKISPGQALFRGAFSITVADNPFSP